MAKDLKEKPLSESEEFDFQSDDGKDLFGKPEYVVYCRVLRKRRLGSAKKAMSKQDHIRGLRKNSKIRRKHESKIDNKIK